MREKGEEIFMLSSLRRRLRAAVPRQPPLFVDCSLLMGSSLLRTLETFSRSFKESFKGLALSIELESEDKLHATWA